MNLDAKSKEILTLLDSYKKLKTLEPLKFYTYYEWQKEAINSLKDNTELTLLAGNRTGKTLTGTSILAFNCLGEFPDWYDGIRYDHPMRILALGVTGEQMRDVIMKTLIGDVDPTDKVFLGGGLIPKHKLHDPIFDNATRGALREVKVRHKAGHYSVIKFRSYSQGPEILRGPTYDICLIDEEPPMDQGLPIYAECLARIALGGTKGKGGKLILTFTPENGFTALVDLLYNHPKPKQKLMVVGWKDAPHISEEVKAHLLATIPPYLIPCKTEGRPSFGDSKVYKILEADIICEPFPIPDHFYVLCGIDLGIDHPFAACFCALDRDKNMLYVFDGWEMTNAVPTQHVARINAQFPKIPIIYPHDLETREKGSGETVRTAYEMAGANLTAKFSNDDGSNYVEPGLLKLTEWMLNGNLKVFSTYTKFWDSYRKFRRNPTNGKLIEDGKDTLDAFRYCALSIHRYGKQKNEVGNKKFIKRSYPILNL